MSAASRLRHPGSRTTLATLSIACGLAAYWGLWHEYRNWQFFLWLASLALLLVAYWDRAPRTPSPSPEREPWSVTELCLLAAIVGLAAFFRLHRLDTLPPSLWVDECHAIGRAGELVSRKPFLPFGCMPLTWIEQWVQTSNLYLYSVALTLAVFGHDYFGMKMVSVLPGIAGVPALYLFCRELAGRHVALFAGFFFAAGHWNVRLSRWGWDEIMMTTLQVVAFFLLVRGVREGKRHTLVLAGITMGLCLYTYIASRLVLASVLACFAIQIATRWRSARTRLAELALFSLATLLTVAPLSVFYIQHPHLFNVRTREVTVLKLVEEASSLQPLWDNLKRHLLMFHVRGDWIPKHALPYEPMLDAVTGALFVAGFAVTLWKWRSFGHMLCQCWFWFGLMAGVLSQNGPNPHAYRTGNVAPVVMAMAALPAGLALSALLRPGRWLLARRSFAAASATAAIAAAVWLNFANYFIAYPKVPSLWNDMLIARGVNVVRTIRKVGMERQIFLDRAFKDAGFWCLIGDTPVTEWSPDLDPMPRDASKDIVYFLLPHWKIWVQGVYPHSRVTPLETPQGQIYAYMAEIPAADLRASLGLDRILLEVAADGSALPAGTSPAATRTVFEGAFHEREPGFLSFALPSPGVVGIWLNGEQILRPGDRLSDENRTRPGFNSVRFVADGEVERLPPILQRRRSGRPTDPIPLNRLVSDPAAERTGLRARLYASPEPVGEATRILDAAQPAITGDFPPPPYSAVWEGWLRIDRPGEHLFAIVINDTGRLLIDDSEILRTEGGHYNESTVFLSAGLHPIRLEHRKVGSGPESLHLGWIPPGRKESADDGEWAGRGFVPLAENAFYRLPFTGTGLRARYYANTDFEGEPVQTAIEVGPWLAHRKGSNFSIELDGFLQFPSPGAYWLGTTSDDGSWLHLDGKLVVDNASRPTIKPEGAEVNVEAGKHPLRVRYFQRDGGAHLTLYWGRPGQEPSAIPSMFLYPAEG
jgi:4-amino-4-deoxy-L-arabinose transferase-like glycosyltransferase